MQYRGKSTAEQHQKWVQGTHLAPEEPATQDLSEINVATTQRGRGAEEAKLSTLQMELSVALVLFFISLSLSGMSHTERFHFRL